MARERRWRARCVSFTCVIGTNVQVLTSEGLRRHVRQLLSASMAHGGRDRLLSGYTLTSAVYTSTVMPHTLEP
jgi:hypothetical protein